MESDGGAYAPVKAADWKVIIGLTATVRTVDWEVIMEFTGSVKSGLKSDTVTIKYVDLSEVVFQPFGLTYITIRY